MLNIIYDASILTNIFYKDSGRSGIFFAALNIFDELKKRKDVNLSLYFAPENYADGAKLKRDIYPDCHYAQDMSKFHLLGKMCRFLKRLYSRFYNHTRLRKIFALSLECFYFVYRRTIKITEKEKESCDIFFSPVFNVPDFVRLFPNIRPFTFVYDFIPLRFPQYYPNGKPLVSVIMELAKDGDFFFFDSMSAKQDARFFFPSIVKDNAAVIPLAANENFRRITEQEVAEKIRNKYHIPHEKKYIFSLCTLEPRKNLIRAVSAFLIFIEKNKIDDLVWVMGGSAWASFISMLNDAGKSWDKEKIVRAGYVDDSDLPVLYSNAEWFVYTSQYEGFGLPPLEAMQCGCPVITSNNSSLPEVVGDAGIMIDWDDEEQHIQSYEKFYFNESLRKEYGQKGLKRAKNFSWEKTVNQIISVMENNKCRN